MIRLQLLVKSVTGEELARELINTLAVEYGTSSDHLLALMRDRASVNTVAIEIVKVLFPRMLDVGCFSHTLDHGSCGGSFPCANSR